MPAPIQPTDNALDRFSKMLPADVTAAFISTKTALVSSVPENQAHWTVITSFLVILVLCPFYFRYVTKVESRWHRYFLVASSGVFAFALAEKQVATFLIDLFAVIDNSGKAAAVVNPTVSSIATVLPILWTLLISQIAVSAFSNNAIATSEVKPI